MPDYSDKTKFPDIGKVLAAQGSQIGEFDQTAFNKYYDSVGGKALDSGFCAGVVTDWLRKILLTTGEKARRLEEELYVTYNYAAIERGDAKIGEKEKTLAKAKEDAEKTVMRMGTAFAKKPSWTQPGSAAASDPWYVKEDSWKSTATTLDSVNLRKKKFSSLELIASKHMVYDGPSYWKGAILGGGTSAGPIDAGCGAKLGFRLPGQTGHAVAVWRRKVNTDQSDSYYFFDPNYGVFAFSKTGLGVALQILFWYDDDDTPKYKTCTSKTKTEMDYIIFGPANIVSAVPVQKQQPSVQVPVSTTQPPQVPTASTSAQTPPKQTLATTSNPTVQPTITSAQSQPQPQGSSASGYILANKGLGSPGNTTSKAAAVTTKPATTGQGKHADLITKLEKLKDDGKPLDLWDGKSTGNVGGVLNLKQPEIKDIKAALEIVKPWGKDSPFRPKGTLTGIAVNDLTVLITALKK